MATRVAINGLGRVGRAMLRSVLREPGMELAAVNDLAPVDDVAYLLRYDTVYGRFGAGVSVDDSTISVDGYTITVFSERDPARLPWSDLGVDVVFECTGVFRREEDLRQHLEAGAQMVILSAPAKDDLTTIVYGVNQQDAAGSAMVSCASCTTNCIAPVMEVLDRRIGVRKATMTTVHAYTSSQGLVDGPARERQRGRAAASNIVPTTTGAARAAAQVVPALRGRFSGLALRVPVPVGSIADIVAVTSRDTTVDELSVVFREEAAGDRYRDILGVTEDPIVSSDVIADPRACLVDLPLASVTDGDLVKLMVWYDNEWGYAQQMLRYAQSTVGALAGHRDPSRIV